MVVLARAGYFTQLPADALTYRSTYPLPEGLRFAPPPSPGPSGRFALSPDGRWLAFVATDVNGRVQLWVRAMDTFAAKPLAGTDDASYPFWSPDSRSIAFIAQNTLKTIGVSGGPPVTISETAAPGRGDLERRRRRPLQRSPGLTQPRVGVREIVRSSDRI